jgi:hypothetical protein
MDIYTHYEHGLRNLLEQLPADNEAFTDFLVYEHRLKENIRKARLHGDSTDAQVARSEIIHRLNELTLTQLGKTFESLCTHEPTQQSVALQADPAVTPHGKDEAGTAQRTIVRKFLYLNTDTVNDNLSGVDETLSAPAKFQRFHAALAEQGSVTQLNALDLPAWRQLRRGDVLEIESSIQTLRHFLMEEATEVAGPLAKLMPLFGQDPMAEPGMKEKLEAAGGVAEMLGKEDVPLLFHAIETPKFQFIAYLSRQYLRCRPSGLRGTWVVFGTVQQVIPPGERYTISVINPGLDMAMTQMNRQQRRKANSTATPQNTNKGETVKGPAIIVEAIAVYR